MAARRKAPVPAPTRVEQIWKQYGTWIATGVMLVLAVVLVVVLVQRYGERQVRTQRAEFASVSATQMRTEAMLRSMPRGGQPDNYGQVRGAAAQAERRIRQLLITCSDPGLQAQMELKLAQMLLKQERYAEAEELLLGLEENETLHLLERVHVRLGLAYAAQGQRKLAEARTRWEGVVEDKLYALEARRQMALIDKTLKSTRKPSPSPPPVVTTP